MNDTIKTKILLPGLMALIATAPGCGMFGWLDRSKDYRDSETRRPLEVPPDLSEPPDDRTMEVPQSERTASVNENSVEPPDLDDTSRPEAPDVDLPRDASGVPYLELNDTVESAWRRTGLALERTGFEIQERDEARRLFTVRYVPPEKEEEDGGFFDWLFGGDDEEPRSAAGLYRVSVVGAGETLSRVTVLDQAGDPQSGQTAERILSLLAARLG